MKNLKFSKVYKGYYEIFFKGSFYSIHRVKFGHWEIVKDKKYWDTACSLMEAKILIQEEV